MSQVRDDLYSVIPMSWYGPNSTREHKLSLLLNS